MKTTSQKLLTSLLALGLTSSAGLYAQVGSTAPINTSIAGDWDGTAGLQSWTYADNPFLQSEDLDGDGVLDQTLDLNNDTFVNNGGTGVDANGNTVLLAGEGALLNEVADNVDYNGDGDQLDTEVSEIVNGDSATFIDEDVDNSGFISGFEDRDGDGNLDVAEDLNDNDELDVTTDLNGDGIVNNGGSGVGGGFLAGEGALLDEVADNVDYNGDGDQLDVAVDERRSGVINTFVNEDIDGDGNLDLFNEDVNRNGTLDTDLPNRNFVASLDADGDLQDIDFLVENDLFVNGEKVLVESRTLAARGSEGIEGVIEKRADGTIQLGENSFLFDEATDTISTSSGDINLDADVDITGDLTIAGLTGDVASRINNNSSRIESNQENIEQNTRGIAMVAALQHTTVLPGMTNAFDLSAAYFEGETGLALNFARRLSDNVQINFGAASTTDFDESVIKAGIGVQW